MSELLWAGAASTLHRARGGEGALFAINVSLILKGGLIASREITQILISLLAIALMYAFNDLYDAPTDSNNPKKDQEVVSIYLAHRWLSGVVVLTLKLLTVVAAYVTLDLRAAAAVAGVMLVNILYSTKLKGVAVMDVVWCGLWGAVYAAIVSSSSSELLLVGLMTAVCHLYQTLGDRAADAANLITTTAVRSAGLSATVLAALTLFLYMALREPVGSAWATTAFVPLVIYFSFSNARTGWLLTKAYFGVLWLYLLGTTSAVG